MAGLRSPSAGAGLEVRLLHAAALEHTSPRTQRGHSAGPGHSARGGAGTNRGGDHLSGWRGVRRSGSVALSAQSLPGRRLGGYLRAAHESPSSSLPVPRRAALRRLAPRRRAAAGRRRRRVPADPGAARMRPGRLGGPRGRGPRGPPPGPGGVPEPEQEGRARPQIRAVRAAAVGHERDAADHRRGPRQRLPDRAAATQEALLTEDRDARQALQAVLPDHQDPGGRRGHVRVVDSPARPVRTVERSGCRSLSTSPDIPRAKLSRDSSFERSFSPARAHAISANPREEDPSRFWAVRGGEREKRNT